MQEEEAIRRLPLGPPSALTPFPVLIWAPGAVGRGSPGQGTAVQVLLGTGGSHIAGFPLLQGAETCEEGRKQEGPEREAVQKLKVAAGSLPTWP